MRSSFHKYILSSVLTLCSVFLFFLFFFPAQHAHAAPSPTLTVLWHVSEFDFDDCTSVTLAGKNFTRSGTAMWTKLGNLSATPGRLAVGYDGNFEAKVNFCYIGYKGSGSGRLVGFPQFTISALDVATGKIVTARPISVIDPQPRMQVASHTALLLDGCATVRITGDHFIASGLATNTVSLLPYRVDEKHEFPDDRLPHQPLQVSTLGGGNIAISTLICGLRRGESFYMILQDRASYAGVRTVIQTY